MVNTVANNKLRKRVSFGSSLPQSSPLHQEEQPESDHHQQQQVIAHSCHCFCDGLEKEERKAICWYSVQDLQPCRDEAKDAIQQLQMRLEQGTLDSLPDHVVLRGIEKYADAAGKYRKQRIYIESVLHQQRALKEQQRVLKASFCNSDVDAVENLANLSRYLSQASTELARFYAGRCAAELSLLRHEEEDEEDDEEWDEEEVKYNLDSSSTCSSEIDVHESKANTDELCPVSSSTTIDISSKRKRSRCHAFGDTSMPPRKIQCCE
ncbi:unnamed protein product [Cylindrotheca closterium]|uniref:Uncharacterized protein n=1 Tax=Cylindrotheca closterium TaxID=2856 RepID=A0AAD2G2Z8_9STRA|nr:unnamed protein product [Cylindrotheca closterium]